MNRPPRHLRTSSVPLGVRLWAAGFALLAKARSDHNRIFSVLRVAGPSLVLFGLVSLLPDRGRLATLKGAPYDFVLGLLFGMGASWTVVFGFTNLPRGAWRWLRFLGMGSLGTVCLFWIGDALAQAHNALIPHVGGGPWSGTPRTFQGFLVACILTLLFAFFFNRIERHRQEAEEQRRFAEAAQEAALRSRLVPHFIFNALNTLHAQIQGDPKGAEATTERLADLFRQVLALSDDATIPLKQELAFVEAYLGVEQARLGARMKVVVEVPEDLETLPIPPLSLQVLVENAIKHGVAPLEQGGVVRIGAERREGALYLWVEDPGNGASPNKGTGTALETLRQRLARPEDLTMERTATGFRVAFRWRQA